MNEYEFLSPVEINTGAGESAVEEPGVLKKILMNREAMVGITVLIILTLMAVFVPLFSPHDYAEQDLSRVNVSPCAEFLFGTDSLGRDLFSRSFMGLRVSLLIALVATVTNLLIGMNYGIISGYYGGRVDIVMQRVIDVLGSIPTLVVVTLMMVVMKPGIGAIILTLALTGWMDMSLIARSGVLSIKELEYVQAARTMGAGDLYIIRKEIMPNIIEHMLPQIMICVPNAVFLESFLSFAGLGLPVGECSLGTLLSNGFGNVLLHPYKLIPCSVIMLLLMISCHLTAQGMEKVLN